MSKKKINSRSKGQRAERGLVKRFGAWWGSEFFRTPGSGAFATMGFKYEDHDLSGDILTLDKSFPFCVESKHVEGVSLEQLLKSDCSLIEAWWEQTVNETPAGKIPLLTFTRNRQPHYLMVYKAQMDILRANVKHVLRYFEFNIEDGTPTVCIAMLEDLFATSPDVWKASGDKVVDMRAFLRSDEDRRHDEYLEYLSRRDK